MRNGFGIGLLTVVVAGAVGASAADSGALVLADAEGAVHQIVIPDQAPTAHLMDLLRQTGDLVQRAFAENGFDLPVVAEAARAPERPAIFIGDTRFAREQGIDPAAFVGWSYLQRVVDGNLILVGRDAPHPADPEGRDRSMGAQFGTLKGVADFLREHAGVRFLHPDGDIGITYLPVGRIAVPVDLDRHHVPTLRFRFSGRYGPHGVTSLERELYLVANNYFPNVAFVQQPHTYDRAVPVARYRESNPEYFAMLGERRTVEVLPPDRMGHYCLSNPEVQALIYADMLEQVDRGYEMAVLGQQDGFRPCHCPDCHQLYGTGDDWTEKLWLFHLDLAQRFAGDRPDHKVITLIYGPTREPPQSVREFPDNLVFRMRMEGLERLEPWKGYHLPGGIFGALGIFGQYRTLGLTPQRSPLSVAGLARDYHRAGLIGLFLDGFGNMFGMEGPTYYVFGRIFDDPETLEVGDLLEEYFVAAFQEALPPMRRFFSVLHRSLQLHNDLPSGFADPYGQTQGYGFTPFKWMRTLYDAAVINDLDASLSQAEGLAQGSKVKHRLKLIRLEWDYTRQIARVAHLHEAFQIAPDPGSWNRLLDAIDARNAFMDGVFTPRGAFLSQTLGAWDHRPFGRLGRGGVTLPRAYRASPLAWDTAEMRHAPLPGALRLNAGMTDAPAGPQAPVWETIDAVRLGGYAGADAASARDTRVRVAAGADRLLVRIDSELPAPDADPAPILRAEDAVGREAVEVVLDPTGTRERFFRFIVGPGNDQPGYAGATGLIDDPLHPLFGREDPGWEPTWTVSPLRDVDNARWTVVLGIPYAAMGAEPPEAGTVWRGNFARTHVDAEGGIERLIWSSNPETDQVLDSGAFGEIAFAAQAVGSTVDAAMAHQRGRRMMLYENSFEIPAEWRALPDRLDDPFANWRFQVDPADHGLEGGWHAPAFDDANWLPIEVPAFWRETHVGPYLGHGWYRVAFNLPEAWRGRAVQLSFGSIDGQAWIYLNGTLVRERTEESERARIDELWEIPFTARVAPEHLHYGETPNLMAVRVFKRRGNAGIWRPVLINALD